MLREMVISRNIWKIPDRYAVYPQEVRLDLRGWGVDLFFPARRLALQFFRRLREKAKKYSAKLVRVLVFFLYLPDKTRTPMRQTKQSSPA
jgi:hypothetical protein